MAGRAMSRGRARPVAGLAGVVVLVAATLTACDPYFDVAVTNPGMYPVFQRSVTDYVNRCDPDRPTRVEVSAPPGARVSVAGERVRAGTFTVSVRQRVNERFTIVITDADGTTIHNVRCLPPDFPRWEAHGNGEAPRTEWFVTTLVNGLAPNRPVIFDGNGVPVWWSEEYPAVLTTPLPNGNLATLHYSGGMLERRLDGTTVRTLDTEGAPSDFHDVLLLPNGNYALVTFDGRPCDLSPWGQPSGTCVFHEVQELTPEGEVVWRWKVEDDIPITETPPRWRSTTDPLTQRADPWHYNSIEWVGDGFIMSFRHLDAIYKVDYATKDIVWKLGGSPRAESLRVVGDPIFDRGSSISGQHDARMLPDGTVSLYDNRTASTNGQRPRVVRYRIDEAAGTATLVSSLRDPIAPVSPCCGSGRLLPSGSWVVGWGGTTWFTENRPDGTQVFRLKGADGGLYRVIPLAPGVYTREQIRAGMDAQYDGAALSPAARSGPLRADRNPDARGDLGFRLGTEAPPTG